MRMPLVALLWLAGIAGCSEPAPDNTLRVSGHVEATEVQVAPEVGGRLLELRADEGDRVNAGDVVARLDTRDTQLQIDRARAERGAAAAQVRLLRAGARPEDIRQAEAQVDAAAAEAAALEAEVRAAATDLARFDALLKANAGSEKQRDDAKARVEVGAGRVRAARERVSAAREAVASLRAGARRRRGGRRGRPRRGCRRADRRARKSRQGR